MMGVAYEPQMVPQLCLHFLHRYLAQYEPWMEPLLCLHFLHLYLAQTLTAGSPCARSWLPAGLSYAQALGLKCELLLTCNCLLVPVSVLLPSWVTRVCEASATCLALLLCQSMTCRWVPRRSLLLVARSISWAAPCPLPWPAASPAAPTQALPQRPCW